MTWKSHIAISTAITLPFNPAAIPIAAIGATAPDWLEYALKFFGVRVTHREETHYLIIPIAIIVFSFFFDFKNLIFWFGIGYLSHWIADSLTRSGVPISPWDMNRVHFFGGKLVTGEPAEYIVAFSILAFSVLIFRGEFDFFRSNEEPKFNAYYINYKKLYDEGIIDEKEFKENRFKLF